MLYALDIYVLVSAAWVQVSLSESVSESKSVKAPVQVSLSESARSSTCFLSSKSHAFSLIYKYIFVFTMYYFIYHIQYYFTIH